MKDKLRWAPYVLMRNQEIREFVRSHFCETGNRKLLYILGQGFDNRMNIGVESLMQECAGISIKCLVIQFDEGKSSSSRKYRQLVSRNFDTLRAKLGDENIDLRTISLWSDEARRAKRKRVGDHNAADIFELSTLEGFTDVIVDVSALPRGIYFSMIGKIQALVDDVSEKVDINLFVFTSENTSLDANIRKFQSESELSYVYGFRGGSELTSDKKQTIWLPILGEGSAHQISAAYQKILPDEICPVLPFPSKDPRRSDSLLIEYHQLLFDELNIEGQNIIYVPEQNPFEVYRTLAQTIRDYYDTLAVLKGCDVVISTFSSKLLSIGALLCAYEFKDSTTVKVGVLNVDSSGYEIIDETMLDTVAGRTEVFLIWLSGEAYKK